VGAVGVSRVIEAVARRVGVPAERLEREAVREWLERRLALVEAEIAEVRRRYGVESVEELERLVREGKVPEHPGWEDLITLERLVEERRRLREALESVRQA